MWLDGYSILWRQALFICRRAVLYALAHILGRHVLNCIIRVSSFIHQIQHSLKPKPWNYMAPVFAFRSRRQSQVTMLRDIIHSREAMHEYLCSASQNKESNSVVKQQQTMVYMPVMHEFAFSAEVLAKVLRLLMKYSLSKILGCEKCWGIERRAYHGFCWAFATSLVWDF